MRRRGSTKLTVVTVLFPIREVPTFDHSRITVYAGILPVSSLHEYSNSVVADFWTYPSFFKTKFRRLDSTSILR
jgi:hypothetical protein